MNDILDKISKLPDHVQEQFFADLQELKAAQERERAQALEPPLAV